MTTAETASSKDLVRRWKTKAKKLIDIIERDSEADVLDVPQGLTPITIFQALSATQVQQGDPVIIDSRSSYLVSIVCVLKQVLEDGAQLNFLFEDHTGQISGCQIITQHGSTQYSETDNSLLSWANTYVTVVGCLGHTTSTTGLHQLDIHSIRPVADPNEITLHLLDVLHVHVRRTQPYPTECHHAKDSNGANGLLADTNASRQRGRPGRIPPTGEYLSRVQRMILEVCKTTPLEHHSVSGIHLSEIVHALGKHTTEEEIRAHLVYLSSEGLVYTTISDDHWQAQC